MKAIIYGIGSFAEYVSYVLSNDSNYDVIAFCIDSNLIQTNEDYKGLSLVPFETVQNIYSPLEYDMFIAVGNNEIREKKFQEAIDKGFNLLSYVSSKSNTWENLKYGRNVFISEDTGIQPFVKIADNNILIGARIGHHAEIGKNNLLSCCYLAGNVKISNNKFFGMNSAVKQGVLIGSKNIIGMGCTIAKNISDDEIYSINKMTKKSTISATAMRNKYLR